MTLDHHAQVPIPGIISLRVRLHQLLQGANTGDGPFAPDQPACYAKGPPCMLQIHWWTQSPASCIIAQFELGACHQGTDLRV